ncbi:tRNA nucleotidyl transferase/poly(A) polymerase [Curvibacter phage P26059A]|nr:tRNA nucleotidyl transferase/poly(A) polymerase [Curvibacter phage P26059A]
MKFIKSVFYKLIIMWQIIAAKRMLSNLWVLCPTAVVAGGAPRDWYFGKPAKDIDCYITDVKLEQVQNLFKMIGVKIKEVKKGENRGEYARDNNLELVVDFRYMFLDFQLMLMQGTTVGRTIDRFPVSICKIEYDGTRVEPSYEFAVAEAAKVLLIDKRYKLDDPYIVKIIKKFPDYEIMEDSNINLVKLYRQHIEVINI